MRPVKWWGSIHRGNLGREREMRWARWAVRHYGRYLPKSNAPKHPLVKAGEPTPQALQAKRWGAPVPKTIAEAQKIARRGYQVLDKWRDR